VSEGIGRAWRGRFFRRIFARVGFLVVIGMLVVSLLTWEILQSWLREYINQQLSNQARLAQVAITRCWPDPTAEQLQSACESVREATGLRTTVIDPFGVVLADSDAPASAMENHAGRAEVAAALSGKMGTDRRLSATVQHPFVYVAAPMQFEGRLAAVVRVAAPAEDIERREAALVQWIGIAVGVALPLTLLIAWFLSKRLAGPVQQVSAWAQRLATGDLDARLDLSGGDEVGQVAGALERMRINLVARIREVQQRRQDLEITLAHLEEGVIAVDASGIVLMENEAARRLLGNESTSCPDRLGKGLENTFLRKTWEDARRNAARELRREITLEHGGRKRTLNVTITRVPESRTSIAWLLCLQDITALARSAAMKAEFVANASHELRTPVASIRAAAETLRADGLEAEQRMRFMSVIERNIERLQNLTEDLIHLNRVESASPELNITTFRIEEILASLRSSFAEPVRQKRASLSFASEVDEMTTDPRWLELVLKNLIDNSVKFISEGGRVEVRCWQEDGNTAFVVEDDGCGIPPADLERVFERFYQVDRSRSLSSGGTGLGLAIVKHAVHALGGEVSIQSEVGRGTTVKLRLPSPVPCAH